MAEKYLQTSIKQQNTNGDDWVHYVDWFYLGLTKLNQKKYTPALAAIEKALAQNPDFPDALYYKAQILHKQKHSEEAKTVLLKAKKTLELGYRMNEDNEVYTNYPFQITLFEVEELLNKHFF